MNIGAMADAAAVQPLRCDRCGALSSTSQWALGAMCTRPMGLLCNPCGGIYQLDIPQALAARRRYPSGMLPPATAADVSRLDIPHPSALRKEPTPAALAENFIGRVANNLVGDIVRAMPRLSTMPQAVLEAAIYEMCQTRFNAELGHTSCHQEAAFHQMLADTDATP